MKQTIGSEKNGGMKAHLVLLKSLGEDFNFKVLVLRSRSQLRVIEKKNCQRCSASLGIVFDKTPHKYWV